MTTRPFVGETVHYRSYGTPGGEYTGRCRAAVVTERETGVENAVQVGLAVLNPTGLFFHSMLQGGGVRFGPEPMLESSDPDGGHAVYGYAPGTWHYPSGCRAT